MRGAEAVYLRYKPGTSCLVGYRVRLGGGETLAYARASRLDQPDKVHKGTQRRAVPSALGGGVRVAVPQALTVYPFPHDHEMRAAGPPRRRRAPAPAAAAAAAGSPALWGGTSAAAPQARAPLRRPPAGRTDRERVPPPPS